MEGGKGGKPAAADVRASYVVLYYGCRKGEEERAMMMNKQMLFPCSSRRREGGGAKGLEKGTDSPIVKIKVGGKLCPI